MKKLFKFLFPLLFLVVGFAGYRMISSTRPELPQIAQQAPEQFVFVQKAIVKNETPTLRLFGVVETPDFASLAAAVESDVEAVEVLEGDSVEAGELLISLDRQDLELDVQQRQSDLQEIEASIASDRIRHATDKRALETEKSLLELSRNSVERSERLVQNNAGSQATLDNALQNVARQQLAIIQREQAINDFPVRQKQLAARLDKARAALARAQRDLARTNIVAPFDGRIDKVLVATGDRVLRGGKLLNLYNESELEVRAQIPFSFVAPLKHALKNDQPVAAQAIYENQRIDLTLHRLKSLVEKGQAGIDVFFRSASSRLPALGSTLDILLFMPMLENVVIIPPDALYNGSRVYVVADGALEARKVVQVGTRIENDGSQSIILDGAQFSADENILTSRLPQAVSGLKVNIVQQD